jgi:hypothetical protein
MSSIAARARNASIDLRRISFACSSRGVYVAYASSSRALAILEYLALFGVRLPEDAAERIALDALPEDWNRIPAPSTLAAIGDAWIRARSSLTLKVPSVVAPGDDNVLINPGHPAFHTILFDDPVLNTNFIMSNHIQDNRPSIRGQRRPGCGGNTGYC